MEGRKALRTRGGFRRKVWYKMKSTMRKNIIGIVLGVLVVNGSFGAAAYAHSNEQTARQTPSQQGEMKTDKGHPIVRMPADEQARHVAQTFGVSETEVNREIEKKTDLYDIGYAAMLAKISGKSFSDVIRMKTKEKDWQEIIDALGITKEAFYAQVTEMVVMHINIRSGVDGNTARALLQKGYGPHDIEMAGIIAKAAHKDIRSVLDRRRDNNSWENVADEFGVDQNLLKSDRPDFPPMSNMPTKNKSAE